METMGLASHRFPLRMVLVATRTIVSTLDLDAIESK